MDTSYIKEVFRKVGRMPAKSLLLIFPLLQNCFSYSIIIAVLVTLLQGVLAEKDNTTEGKQMSLNKEKY